MSIPDIATLEASYAQLQAMLTYGSISPETYAAATQELLLAYSDAASQLAYGAQNQVSEWAHVFKAVACNRNHISRIRECWDASFFAWQRFSQVFFDDCCFGLQMVFVPANGTSPYMGRPAVGYAASQCCVWLLSYSTLLHAAMREAPLTTTAGLIMIRYDGMPPPMVFDPSIGQYIPITAPPRMPPLPPAHYAGPTSPGMNTPYPSGPYQPQPSQNMPTQVRVCSQLCSVGMVSVFFCSQLMSANLCCRAPDEDTIGVNGNELLLCNSMQGVAGQRMLSGCSFRERKNCSRK
jgi:hypothetical protein